MLTSSRWREAKASALASTDIVELIGQSIPLKRQGKDYVGLCPFHQERTPSFHVSPAKQFFHCFGCKAHGNAIDFIVKRDHVSFADALRALGEKRRTGGVPVPQQMAPRPTPTPRRQDLDVLARSFATAVNPSRLQRFAQAMGLTSESLERLSIGWAGERFCGKCQQRRNAWAFPMTDAAGKVLGIRLRFVECNHKSAVAGGREGLFIPCGLEGNRLSVSEGPTDTAAMLDLGFATIGRPSCTGGLLIVLELLKARHRAGDTISQLVIVADGDGPGQRGARQLASAARVYCPIVQIITPPAGIKDARAWKRGGATAADVERAVWAAPRRPLRVVTSLEGVSK